MINYLPTPAVLPPLPPRPLVGVPRGLLADLNRGGFSFGMVMSVVRGTDGDGCGFAGFCVRRATWPAHVWIGWVRGGVAAGVVVVV